MALGLDSNVMAARTGSRSSIFQPGPWATRRFRLGPNSSVPARSAMPARAGSSALRDGAVAARLRSRSTRSVSNSSAFTPSRLARSTSPRYTAYGVGSTQRLLRSAPR